MYVSVWMCVYMSMCVCNIFVYKSIIKTTCDKISSTDSSSKQLYMTCGYITINKTNKTNKTIFTVVGGEPDQFCWRSKAKMTIEIPETVALVING